VAKALYGAEGPGKEDQMALTDEEKEAAKKATFFDGGEWFSREGDP
jgi:hypothetical protein